MNLDRPKVRKDDVSQDEQSSDCELLLGDTTTEGKGEKVAPLPNSRRAGLRASTRLAKAKKGKEEWVFLRWPRGKYVQHAGSQICEKRTIEF